MSRLTRGLQRLAWPWQTQDIAIEPAAQSTSEQRTSGPLLVKSKSFELLAGLLDFLQAARFVFLPHAQTVKYRALRS